MPTPTTDVLTNPTNLNPATDAPAYRAALDALRETLNAMPEEHIVRPLRLDPGSAAMIAEAAATKLAPLRAAVVAQFGAEGGAKVDALPMIARAARQADIELFGAWTNPDLASMNDKVREEHTLLMTDADALANRKLLDPQWLAPARNTQGYQALIRSLLVLVFVLRENWAKIDEHTPLTLADLDRAEGIAQRMSAALGDREAGINRSAGSEMRIRAVSYLIRQYDEIRRMVSFLRWSSDDADTITPTLFPGGRKRGGRPQDGTDTDGPGTDVPTPVLVEGPAPVSPSPVSPAPAIVAPTPVAPVPPMPVNGGGPFTA